MGNMLDFFNLYYFLLLFNFILWILYLIIIVVGIVGNFFVVCIVYRNKNMYIIINCIFFNFVILDLMFLIFCLIFMVVEFVYNFLKGFVR